MIDLSYNLLELHTTVIYSALKKPTNQDPYYVLKGLFYTRGGTIWKFCSTSAIYTPIYHYWELSNEVLYFGLPQGLSKIQLAKVEKSISI